MKKLITLAAALATATLLTACGGGGSDPLPPQVASANINAPVTASTVGAAAGQSFTFDSGVSALGTTSPTTLTVNSASTFSIDSTEGTASGNLSFGSCIFTVTKSTFPSGSKLALGQRLEVTPCSLEVPTKGVPTAGGAVLISISFNLGGAISGGKSITVDVLADGTVVVNGTTVGKVPVTTTTGATGGA